MCLCYKSAIFWKMQAGMGDTIFTPLHQVLEKRGVRFEFFHRVDRLELADEFGKGARCAPPASTSSPSGHLGAHMKKDIRALGWPMASAVTDTYSEPMDTWADMTHLLPRETWSAAPRRADDKAAHVGASGPARFDAQF